MRVFVVLAGMVAIADATCAQPPCFGPGCFLDKRNEAYSDIREFECAPGVPPFHQPRIIGCGMTRSMVPVSGPCTVTDPFASAFPSPPSFTAECTGTGTCRLETTFDSWIFFCNCPTPEPTPTPTPTPCEDHTLSDGSAWHDAGGPDYTCDFYAIDPQNCELFGDLFSFEGLTANQACCVCGGGSHVPRCTDKTLASGAAWVDSHPDFPSGCDYYETDPSVCESDGHLYPTEGLTANDACCVCGGGDH